MASANTIKTAINSTADFTVEFVDTTSAQGEFCDWCSIEGATCVADVEITTHVCRFEGEYRESQPVCWECIPSVLRGHVGDSSAVVELPEEMRPHIIVNGHSLVAA